MAFFWNIAIFTKEYFEDIEQWLENKDLLSVTDAIQAAVWECGTLKDESEEIKNKMISYAKKAAELGNIVAMNQLGAIYNEGVIIRHLWIWMESMLIWIRYRLFR